MNSLDEDDRKICFKMGRYVNCGIKEPVVLPSLRVSCLFSLDLTKETELELICFLVHMLCLSLRTSSMFH